jgi:DNA helicase-2/ATP-dependent DNA helicase PcrA
MKKNQLIIAAAGSGKTTFLIKEAVKNNTAALITTYTEANEKEIIKKFYDIHGLIPENIKIQTWFSFLLQHGIKPYQGVVTDKKITGLNFVNEQSALGIAEKTNLDKYYFDTSHKVYSDKISKLTVRCNEKSNGEVINRISRIYSFIYIDEAQDMSGYDLDIIKLLFDSKSSITLVCDPRQATYTTHNEKRFYKYRDGKLEEFVVNECDQQNCFIDKNTLKFSHRNNAEICSFSSKLYPSYLESKPCTCYTCRSEITDHEGIYLIRENQVSSYVARFNPTILRFSKAKQGEWNFGMSKGMGFDRILIYPPNSFFPYLHNGILTKIEKGIVKDAFHIAKLYVAITRARHSVGIVYNYIDTDNFISGINKFD